MIRLYMTVASLLLLLTSPALAAEFYLAQDPATKKCTVVETKPDGSKMVMIGTSSYATKEEAKAAKQAASECLKPDKKPSN